MQTVQSDALKLGETTLRYWKASLAWRDIDNWADGWTQESFMNEVREICYSPYLVGNKADDLLDDVIHNREHRIAAIKEAYLTANDNVVALKA